MFAKTESAFSGKLNIFLDQNLNWTEKIDLHSPKFISKTIPKRKKEEKKKSCKSNLNNKCFTPIHFGLQIIGDSAL